jgi:hypothetical protein
MNLASAGNMPSLTEPEIKQQLKRANLLRGLVFLLLVGGFIADLSGKLPGSPGSPLIIGGTVGLTIALLRLLRQKKKKLLNQLAALRQTSETNAAVPPIAAPE